MSVLCRRRTIVRLVGVGLVSAVTAAAWAEEPKANGVVKKDVPYVPTQPAVVDKMLELAGVKADDVLYDLGCGDGRIVVTAAKRYGCKGVGIDIDPQRIAESNENAQKAGVTDKVKFVIQDLFQTDYRDVSVLTMYLLPEVNMKLRPTILKDLKPGTRVVSHDFDMEDWEPEETVNMDEEGATVYFWVVPAHVEGSWDATIKGANGQERRAKLSLKQQFQKVSGTAEVDGKKQDIAEGKLRGTQLTFTLPTGANGAGVKYTCQVNGKTIDGVAEKGGGANGDAAGEARLAATRVEPDVVPVPAGEKVKDRP